MAAADRDDGSQVQIYREHSLFLGAMSPSAMGTVIDLLLDRCSALMLRAGGKSASTRVQCHQDVQ
jgi:hypothetical protein